MTAFFKYQALGNDFILIDHGAGNLPSAPSATPIDYSALAIQYCDRNFGIGSDGLIVLNQNTMDFYNPDGTVDFCGNGIRCAAFHRYRQARFDTIEIETIAGGIPVRSEGDDHFTAQHQFKDSGTRIELELPTGDVVHGLLLNPGTPHLCIDITQLKINSLDELQIESFGRLLGEHADLSEPVTVDFIDSRHVAQGEVSIRIWERGVGETLGCGTGALSTGIFISQAHGQKKIEVLSPGGVLTVKIMGEGTATLGGVAGFVFAGSFETPC